MRCSFKARNQERKWRTTFFQKGSGFLSGVAIASETVRKMPMRAVFEQKSEDSEQVGL